MGIHSMLAMKLALLCLVASASAFPSPISSPEAYTWKSCGTKLDRLFTKKVSVAGSLTAGSKVTVTASGSTDLHVPLDTGAWQVRIYELGEAKSTHTEVGDLMKALEFTDAKNTTFKMTASFTLPKKLASGKFDANLVAIDQAKADYLCLDIEYSYSATEALAASAPMWQRWGHKKDIDPLGKHCFDVSVDTSDSKAAEWLRGNEYLYTEWKDGLCDSSVWPKVEYSTHPGVSTKVTERKLGHGTMALSAPLNATGMNCPGSKAWGHHAKTTIVAKFQESCDVVRAEVTARAKGSAAGTWTDPHNLGVYTIESDSGSSMKFDHLTGNKKYHDKILFTFSDSQNGGCTINACSESQVFSVLDFSTNFCNSHDLYCGDAGCHVIKSKLTYTEDISAGSGQKSTSDCYKK